MPHRSLLACIFLRGIIHITEREREGRREGVDKEESSRAEKRSCDENRERTQREEVGYEYGDKEGGKQVESDRLACVGVQR